MRRALLVLVLTGPAGAGVGVGIGIGVGAALTAGAAAWADTGQHREGEYGGVTPGKAPEKPEPGKPEPGKPGKPGKPERPGGVRPAKGTLSWIGFEAKAGGAQVFFQSAAAFEVQQHLEGATLVVHLGLVRLGQNTWRQVDTRFFDTSLAGMAARTVGAVRASKGRPARGAGIDVRITFKSAKDAREGALRTATEADGLFYAYLTFPAGTEAAPAGKLQDPEQ